MLYKVLRNNYLPILHLFVWTQRCACKSRVWGILRIGGKHTRARSLDLFLLSLLLTMDIPSCLGPGVFCLWALTRSLPSWFLPGTISLPSWNQNGIHSLSQLFCVEPISFIYFCFTPFPCNRIIRCVLSKSKLRNNGIRISQSTWNHIWKKFVQLQVYS